MLSYPARVANASARRDTRALSVRLISTNVFLRRALTEERVLMYSMGSSVYVPRGITARYVVLMLTSARRLRVIIQRRVLTGSMTMNVNVCRVILVSTVTLMWTTVDGIIHVVVVARVRID